MFKANFDPQKLFFVSWRTYMLSTINTWSHYHWFSISPLRELLLRNLLDVVTRGPSESSFKSRWKMLTALRRSYINRSEWNSLPYFVNLYFRSASQEVTQHLRIPEELFYNEINHLKPFSDKYLRQSGNDYRKS